jgi:hypothetical protein
MYLAVWDCAIRELHNAQDSRSRVSPVARNKHHPLLLSIARLGDRYFDMLLSRRQRDDRQLGSTCYALSAMYKYRNITQSRVSLAPQNRMWWRVRKKQLAVTRNGLELSARELVWWIPKGPNPSEPRELSKLFPCFLAFSGFSFPPDSTNSVGESPFFAFSLFC